VDKFDLSCYKTAKTVLAAFVFLLLAISGAAAQESASPIGELVCPKPKLPGSQQSKK